MIQYNEIMVGNLPGTAKSGKDWLVDMGEQIFREKSLKRVNSPENLNDYVRVSNPGVWLLLIAVIALLGGAFVWGYFGRLETTVGVRAVIGEQESVCFVPDSEILSVQPGMTVRVENADGETVNGVVREIGTEPFVFSEIADRYALSLRSDEVNRWVFVVVIDISVEIGKYNDDEVEIVTESIKPLSFLFN